MPVLSATKVLIITKFGRFRLATVEGPPPKEFLSPSGRKYRRIKPSKLDLDFARECVAIFEEIG